MKPIYLGAAALIAWLVYSQKSTATTATTSRETLASAKEPVLDKAAVSVVPKPAASGGYANVTTGQAPTPANLPPPGTVLTVDSFVDASGAPRALSAGETAFYAPIIAQNNDRNAYMAQVYRDAGLDPSVWGG